MISNVIKTNDELQKLFKNLNLDKNNIIMMNNEIDSNYISIRIISMLETSSSNKKEQGDKLEEIVSYFINRCGCFDTIKSNIKPKNNV